MTHINRRKALQLSLLATFASSLASCKATPKSEAVSDVAPHNPLTPPADASIPVAFLLSNEAVVIDFCGPWEVFERVPKPKASFDAFRLYTVAETSDPVRLSGGMKVIPEFTIANAPQPKVVVIPAQNPVSEKTKEWIRTVTKQTDVTMSVCTGAFVLASTGLLAGKPATTHHGFYTDLETKYPDIHVQRGARFVEAGNLATAGGLTSGIDLALRVVERYFGEDTVRETANMLEYQGDGWQHPNSNAAFAKAVALNTKHVRCAVCGMDPDPKISSVYKGKTYYFCMREHKQLFDASPDKFTAN